MSCLADMESGFPTGVTISLNGVKPVYSDESPQPIILSLNTSGLLAGHHFLDRSRSNDLLTAPEVFPLGELRDLIGGGVLVSPVKTTETEPAVKERASGGISS
jgi:hypothetical protein